MRSDLEAGEALSIILERTPVLGAETVAVPSALSRVLAEPVASSREIPPADNSAMDGYAVRLADVAGAAGARLSEALRALEETAKTVDPSMALLLERLRYRGYVLAAAVEGRLGTGRARQWPVCLLLTESFCRHPWSEVLTGAIDAGCTCVQVREPDFNDRALVARVRDVVATARSAGVTVPVSAGSTSRSSASFTTRAWGMGDPSAWFQR